MEKLGALVLACMALVSITFHVAFATDPNQLQDFCIATKNPNDALLVNGLFCKDPELATPEDFFLFQGLSNPGSTNELGSSVTRVTATNLPGLNTLGISMARVDFAPFGLNPPHIHPRSTEVITVIQGSLFVGFVASNKANGPNQFFSKVLHEGDVFVFPQGLVHFELNVGDSPAFVIGGFSSQNPGVITVANTMFGSDPSIPTDILSKAFRANKNTIKLLQSRFKM